MVKRLIAISFLSCFVCVVIPSAMGYVFLYEKSLEKKPKEAFNFQEVCNAEIYEEKAEEPLSYNKNALEQYITGVVAAEMPASFSEEALKAQAVAARTYAVKHLDGNFNKINSEAIGQAFISVEEMKKRWGSNFNSNYEKICNAVYSTKGLVIEYNGEPIDAVFHSTSRGVTETAENVWGKSLPYIKSVESKWDEKAPNFETAVSFNKADFEKKIKKSIKSAEKIDNIFDSFKITKKSDAGYVLAVDLGGAIAKGSEVRTALGLRSSSFEVKKEKDKIYFITTGYGHGAGMSQYGAEFMAKDGKSFEEILKHYYYDIKIVNYELKD